MLLYHVVLVNLSPNFRQFIYKVYFYQRFDFIATAAQFFLEQVFSPALKSRILRKSYGTLFLQIPEIGFPVLKENVCNVTLLKHFNRERNEKLSTVTCRHSHVGY